MASDLKEQLAEVKMIGVMAIVILAFGVGAVASDGNLVTGNFFGNNPGDNTAPSDVGEFEKIDYNVYSTPLTLIDSNEASSLYLVSSDVELPEEYGDYTATWNDIKQSDWTEGEQYKQITNTNNDSEYQVKATDIGENEFVSAGETYKVVSVRGDYLQFGEVTVPSGIEKFAYTESKAQTVDYDVKSDIDFTAPSDTETKVVTADGKVASEDLTVSTGLSSRVDTIYSEGEFTASKTFELGDGEALFGSISSVTINETAVSDVTVRVMADGEQVYSKTVDAADASDLQEDLVADKMNYNPVVASDSVTVEVDVTLTDSAESGTQNQLVDFTLEELDGDSQTIDING